MSKDAATHDNLHVDVEDYTETVTRYIEKNTVIKTITTRANPTPSMTAEVRKILRIRDAAFRMEDKPALRSARSDLSRSIKKAKLAHSQKIKNTFCDSRDTRKMWKGI